MEEVCNAQRNAENYAQNTGPTNDELARIHTPTHRSSVRFFPMHKP